MRQTRLNRIFQIDQSTNLDRDEYSRVGPNRRMHGTVAAIGALLLAVFAPVALAQSDFGDAPSGYGTPSSPVVSGFPSLGDLIDTEGSAQHSVDARGDNILGDDDEDGLILPPDFSPGQPYTINAVVSGVDVNNDGFLSVWVDWNGDGVFDNTIGSNERLLNDDPNGTQAITGTVPTGFNGFTYARARVCANSGDCNTPDGASTSEGEVEDYRIRIVPFELGRMACGAEGIVINDPTGIYSELDLLAGTDLGDFNDSVDVQINAIGFNVKDNRVWGYDQLNTSTARLSVSHRDGSVYRTDFVTPNSLPVANYFVGDVNLDGELFLTQGGTTTAEVVDVDPGSPDYLNRTRTLTLDDQSDPDVTLFYADWAFNPTDDQLYALENDTGGNGNNRLLRIDPSTGVVVDLGEPTNVSCSGGGGGAAAYGAQFFDSSGTMYVYCNGSGDIFSIDVTTGPPTGGTPPVITTTAFQQNDGARCTEAGQLGLDFGDLDRPGVRTLSVSDGARHPLSDPTLLHIGPTPPDADSGLLENTAATSDDNDATDDEDAPAYDAESANGNNGNGFFESGEIFGVNLTATNNTGSNAVLCGWIDFDNNGEFDNLSSTTNTDGERECVNVPNGSTNASFELDFTIPVNLFDPDAPNFGSRYRITTAWTSPTDSAINCCGLAGATDGEVEDHVISNSDLPVSIAGFRSYESAEGLVIEWGTVSETRNIGFYLWADRGDGMELLNKDMIPSRVTDAVEPATYRYVVPGMRSKEVLDLAVTAVDVRGKEEIYGLFKPGERYGKVIAPAALDWTSIRQQAAPRIAQHDAAKRAPGALEIVDAVDLQVSAKGMQSVSWEALSNAGLDLTGVPVEQIAVTLKGQPIPRHVVSDADTFGPGSSIRFWGVKPSGADELYVDNYLYRVSVSPDKAQDVSTESVQTGLGPEAVTLEFSEDRDLKYIFASPLADPWYGGVLSDDRNETYSTTFDLPETLHPDRSAELKILVAGYTVFPVEPDHHVRLRVNGEVVDEWMFDGFTVETLEASIPAGLLIPGENTILLEAPGGTNAPVDLTIVDRMRLEYQTSPHVIDDRILIADIPGGNGLTLTGLSEIEAEVYAWTGESLHVLTAERSTGNRDPQLLFGAGFEAAEIAMEAMRFDTLDRPADYWASIASRLYQPAVAGSVADEDILENASGNFLVVAHPAFLPTSPDEAHPLNTYLTHRAQDGWDIALFDIAEIQQHYGWGMPLPEALTRFLAAADERTGFTHVLLVGSDSYDYTDNLGLGSLSFIPTVYEATKNVRHTPSDGLLADLDGDGVSDKAIGRWPVRTEADLASIVEKTMAWDNDPNALENAIWIADSEDRDYGPLTFKDQADRMVDAMIGNGWTDEQIGRIYFDEVAPTSGLSIADTAREQMFARQEQGRSLTGFVGHGSPSMWTFQGLLTPDDVSDLYNTGNPTLIGTMTCYTSYFVSPRGDSVAHRWMNGYREDASGNPIPGVANGAVAIHGPATLSDYVDNEFFVRAVTDRLLQGATLGEAVEAGRARAAADGMTDLVINWILLGDPTLVID